jgi:mono/diheme cytochrome c family protein
MKTPAKVVCTLALALAMGAFAAWWSLPGVTPVASPSSLADAPATTMQIARGAYLARIGNCALCHTTPGGTPYAGGKGIATPFGTVYASNLTPDPNAGLGRWNADDFWRALHHGQAKDGRLLYPAFPYPSYTHVTREDANALWAYLQSLPAAPQVNTPHTLGWPYRTQAALWVWRTLYFRPADTEAAQSTAVPEMARGAYLVQGLAHCGECHGARNRWGAVDPRKSLSGAVLPGEFWYAPSLTAADEASVAGWSREDTVALLTAGTNRHATASGPMAEVVRHSTQYLLPDDATAMATYLASLGQVPAPTAAPAVPAKAGMPMIGARIYDNQCAQCHGKQGEGKPGAYPALAGNRAVQMANTNNLVMTVLHGGFAPATTPNPQPHGMPPFVLTLSDAEIASVLSFVRTSWGNAAAPVSDFDINKIRNAQPH